MLIARRLLGLLLVAAVLVGGWSFAKNHSTPVAIDYWLGTWTDVALWMALLGAFGLGFALTGLLALVEIARLGLLARRYRRAVNRLEEEIHQLRNLPLAADDALREDEATEVVTVRHAEGSA